MKISCIYTDSYLPQLNQLEEDCSKFGYQFEPYRLEEDTYENIVAQKAIKWEESLKHNDQVIWVDADARIRKSIPEEWITDNISVAVNYRTRLRRSDITYQLYNNKTKQVTHFTFGAYSSTFYVMNKKMLPHFNELNKCINMFLFDDYGVSYYASINPKFKELLLEVPYINVIPRTKLDEEELEIIKEDHLISGRPNKNTIISYNELHKWDTEYLRSMDIINNNYREQQIVIIPPFPTATYPPDTDHYASLFSQFVFPDDIDNRAVRYAIILFNIALAEGRKPKLPGWHIDMPFRTIKPEGAKISIYWDSIQELL